MIRKVAAGIELGEIPAGSIRMEPVHEGGVIAHFRRKRGQQMADLLRLLKIHIEIADQDNSALGADRILTPRKFAGGHVAFHDVDAVLRIEGHAGDFVETDHVVLADEAALAARHIDEHAGDRRFAARYEMSIGGHLLEQVTLAGAARSKLDEVVIALDEGNDAQQRDHLGALVEFSRLETDRAQQEVDPFTSRFERPRARHKTYRARRRGTFESAAARRSRTAVRSSPARSPRHNSR